MRYWGQGRTSASRIGLRAFLCLVVLTCVVPAASSASPFQWSRSVRIDHQPPYGALMALNAISCPSDTLCVGADNAGALVVNSTDPTGDPTTWHPLGLDGNHPVYGVSCPTTGFCAAVDS